MFVAPRVIKLAENAVKTGEPIIRPLWWINPEDKNCYDIEDQFLIGWFNYNTDTVHYSIFEAQLFFGVTTLVSNNYNDDYYVREQTDADLS